MRETKKQAGHLPWDTVLHAMPTHWHLNHAPLLANRQLGLIVVVLMCVAFLVVSFFLLDLPALVGPGGFLLVTPPGHDFMG